MNLTPLVILWSLLVLAVLGLALYRKLLSTQEDDLMHIGTGEEKLISQQVQMASKMNALDRWNKMLLVLIVVSGLVLGALFLYRAWESSLNAG
jgi:hypothetical protein